MKRRLDGLRVLVVEDHDDTREFIRVLLLLHGADVVAVPTAEEALGLPAALSYDAIVSDLNLPGRDGCAFLSAVRGIEQGRERAAFAVAYTGEPLDEASRALKHGFDHVVAKPDMDNVVSLGGRIAVFLGNG